MEGKKKKIKKMNTNTFNKFEIWKNNLPKHTQRIKHQNELLPKEKNEWQKK